MSELVDWYRAQLDEDERVARAASPGPWRPNAECDEVLAVDDITVAEGFALSNNQLRRTVEHIAHHDPARVLREVAAKRAIVDAYERKVESMARYPNQGNANGVFSLAVAVQHLAFAYEDRPGYREEWKP